MNDSMDPARRKRINLYKKIIVIMIVAMILLPTILCIILFIKMNFLENEIKGLKADIVQISQQSTVNLSQNEIETIDETESQTPNLSDEETTDSADENQKTSPKTGTATETDAEPVSETSDVTQIETTAPALTEQEQVDAALAQGRKVVYLTFDDGPSSNTFNLLDLLDEYGVKVSFFVNYHDGREAEYQEIVKRGHTLAMHTYSHVYENVYGSLEQFEDEVSSLHSYLYDITGVDSTIFRFPGGSSNSMSKIPVTEFIPYLEEEGYHYFDWNVSSGDGGDVTKDQAYQNVMNGINSHDISVVLMHDSEYKLTTYEAVPDILADLKDMNALVLPITMDTVPVQHQIN